ncbi:metal-responsive CopG/Arc/MetJ family transcriptional regulator [Trueperella bonasi]|uniref:Metal-responsive CopG/Arc/MetJ family transcriptional regulator n=1 Tax=Trueperella bonasi TaxID=312286 RepID=A0ABT9NHF7_9ACTO|nr:ribbon-helix-helix protein, CopG family [Trueperella bonasi]MDP9806622.1 metal-responsive CopG/Arc/MetJ family transcriptional regulator [Trueperella bonasi]
MSVSVKISASMLKDIDAKSSNRSEFIREAIAQELRA